MLFPRMYSSQPQHEAEVQKVERLPRHPDPDHGPRGQTTIIHKPTMGENLRFFFEYQMNWMYWRYFLWNSPAARTTSRGHGGIAEGNWISGIKAIDAQRLGNQDALPASSRTTRAHNRLFLLPAAAGPDRFGVSTGAAPA